MPPIDLLTDTTPPAPGEGGLTRVRLSEDETLVIPFTSSAEPIQLHYVDDDSLGYVPCGGKGCVLCAAGSHVTDHLMLPVYNPTSGAVEVLLTSRSVRPGALLPQLKAVLKAGRPVILFITRAGSKFTMGTSEIPADADRGEEPIAAFVQAMESGLSLLSAFPAYDAELLSGLPSIAKKLKLKGLA